MKTTTDISQAIALAEAGIDFKRCPTIEDLLAVSATPSEGEGIYFSASGGRWRLRYDNAGGADRYFEGSELIDVLVEFTVWKVIHWPNCIHYEQVSQ